MDDQADPRCADNEVRGNLERMNRKTLTPLSDDHPIMIAWEAYRATPEAANHQKWATTIRLSESMQGQIVLSHLYLEGELWSAFAAGFEAAIKWSAERSNEFLDGKKT